MAMLACLDGMGATTTENVSHFMLAPLAPLVVDASYSAFWTRNTCVTKLATNDKRP